MTNKTATAKKRSLLLIMFFLLICFGLMLTFGHRQFDSNAEDTGFVQIIYLLTYFSPAIACIVVRYVSGEGFKDGILYPKFTGHFKAYALSVILPLAYGVICCILLTAVLGAGFNIKLPGGIYTVLGNNMIMSVMMYHAMIILIGEELGWRAFLYDKLEELFGLNAAVVIGGIIWGLWHTPAIIHMGLNFGFDYPGFPYVGIALMCVMCTGFGATLHLLRKMSDSVIAPIIAHALVDTVCNTLITTFLTPELVEGKQFFIGVCLTISTVIMGIPCCIYMNRLYKNQL